MPSAVRAVVAMAAGKPVEVVDIEASGPGDDTMTAAEGPHLDGWIAREHC